MSNVGCYIDDQCMNHLMYADDICILAPTAIAMLQILDICNDYCVANDIKFNSLKSVCLIFRPAKYNLFCPRVHIGSAQLNYMLFLLQSILVLCFVEIKRMTVIC